MIGSGDLVRDDFRKSSDNIEVEVEPPNDHPQDSYRQNSDGNNSSRKNSDESEVDGCGMDIEIPAKKKSSGEGARVAKAKIDGAARKVRRSLELRKNLCVLLCKL